MTGLLVVDEAAMPEALWGFRGMTRLFALDEVVMSAALLCRAGGEVAV